MSNFRRRLMMSIKKSKLPNGYTELEYIESTGTQWIDTEIIPIFNDVVCTNIERTGKNAPIFYAGKNNQFVILPSEYSYGLKLIYTKYFQNKTPAISFHHNYLEIDGIYHNIQFNSNGCLIDGTKVCGISNDRLNADTSLYLFRCNSILGYLKMKNFILKRNNETLLNLIPALNPDGKPCMFDTVTQQPFYNSGTGEFLYG